MGGKIEIREVGELPSWNTGAKTFFGYFDIDAGRPTTHKLGITDVIAGSVGYTTIDVTEFIQSELLQGRNKYTFEYADLANKNVMFWSMSSKENTPKITIWQNLSQIVVDAVNGADNGSIETALRQYSDYLNIDFDMEYSIRALTTL